MSIKSLASGGAASLRSPGAVAPATLFPRTVDMLGGKRLLGHPPASRAEVHASVIGGIPYSVLFHLTENVTVLPVHEIFNVVGISERTLRRQRDTPKKAMPTNLASKTWQFAETLAKAAEVFGGKEEAERWMSVPAMGLDGARPIDLLRTLQGSELVNEFLERLEYGVYV